METISEIVIDRATRDVFEVVADMSRNTEWQKGMKSCVWTSEGPIAVGSTYDQVAGFAGRPIVTSFEVSEFEPGRRIRIVSTKSTFPLDITREVEPIDEGSCKVTATVTGEPSGLLKLLDPITKHLVARSVRNDYARLKEMLETSG
ncbi:MAG: SRPBCC family protein [Acidimicrobiia bacterium]